MGLATGFWIILLSIALYVGLTILAVAITNNREDGTPLWEPLLLSILLTPVLAIMFEMLKPYKIK